MLKDLGSHRCDGGPSPSQGTVAHSGEDRGLHPSRIAKAHERALPGELPQSGLGHRRTYTEGLRHLPPRDERAHPGVAQDEIVQRRAGRRGPCGCAVDAVEGGLLRDRLGDRRPQRQVQVTGVLDPHPVLAPANSHPQGPACIGELIHRRPHRRWQAVGDPGVLLDVVAA